MSPERWGNRADARRPEGPVANLLPRRLDLSLGRGRRPLYQRLERIEFRPEGPAALWCDPNPSSRLVLLENLLDGDIPHTAKERDVTGEISGSYVERFSKIVEIRLGNF